MRKGYDGGEKKTRGGEEINTFLVATNIAASRPPERRLTGTLTTCAKTSLQTGEALLRY